MSSPRSAIEGADVRPDGEVVEVALSLAGEDDAAGVGIKLNSAAGAPSKDLRGQQTSSCPTEKCQLIHISPSGSPSTYILPFSKGKTRMLNHS